ncbi:leucyl/phenylalanyl-tRNA--protein transferase [Sphingobacterium spiritivorum]|uniref:Leucyl/phenylalanyl-tRNA--protein transferase n=1 Tax=Sphingobacterium spiritivorum ATCC 33861 TaxID=525373 RepID=D7VHA5_SPHSI|nr:leucyl/phenylalanyl-tRNA--protein transferase [Sphingobacterium spiritivorum]EFK59457.1 leucyltransferase [Sphingobacterium spiritivorum ATCC 33861]QQT33864.1 leucyl/phenylalanyl-tRNA--protein transferase [Sphingobacterium spiritivorum]WQD34682.1 leucyl/phenylalanyl-tRNA--protein transferase [Sphingobacterium spiritivorum]SUI97692.1 Leucyl/phenylalanyl-tRNA--protein transferase [Sphingobacterium spiritivorum]
MIFQLDDQDLSFPHPKYAEEDGLLAVGGDLSPDRLLLAYNNGIFPWFSDDSPILWYAPHERFVIFPERLKVSKSMKQVLRKAEFKVTVNTVFEQVIRQCAKIERKDQDGTWITNDMIDAYIGLHKSGYAHAIEVWQEDQLVGGLYGVLIGQVFCGESMFSKVPNASKTALIHLFQFFDLKFVDCQFHTDHLASMGGEMISQEDYLNILNT